MYRNLFLVLFLFSLAPLLPLHVYPSLPQTDSGEEGGDDISDEWFPSLVDFPLKWDEGTTSLAGNELPALFEDTVLCTLWPSPESLHFLAQIPTGRVPSHTHTM